MKNVGKQTRGKGKHVRRKHKCECGRKIRSLKNFQRHATARGHKER